MPPIWKLFRDIKLVLVKKRKKIVYNYTNMREEQLPGFLNNVFAEENTVRKQFKEEGLVKIPPARRYAAELAAHERYASNTVVKLPHMYESDTQTLTISMERLRGKTLADMLKETQGQERNSITRQAGKILKAIHTQAPVKASTASYLQHFFSSTEHALRENKEKIQKLGLAPEDILRTMHTRIDPTEATKDGAVFVHRDYSIRNILYNPLDTTMTVIDWEESGIGLPYEDFLIGLRLEEQFPDTTKSFWEGYGKVPHEPTMKGYLLGIFSQLYATADTSYLAHMSTISGVDMQASFANSITNLLS